MRSAILALLGKLARTLAKHGRSRSIDEAKHKQRAARLRAWGWL